MQFLKEMPSGNRAPVTAMQHMTDRYHKDYVPIIKTANLTIYRIGGRGSRPMERNYRYGGRRNHIVGEGYAGN